MKKGTGISLIPHFLWLCCMVIGFQNITGQTVFSDNFNSDNSAAWTTTGPLGAWSVFRSGDDFGARRNTSPTQLECTNDVGPNVNANGHVIVSTPTTSFGSPYNPVLNANTGIITWSFNMRQIRADPSGFDGGSYGVAFIIAAETATDNATGQGYAVVLGGTTSTDPVRLVSFPSGLNPNSELVNIISSNTAGLTDFGADYLSIKVTYNPCVATNQWQMFLRNDGPTGFTDPLTGTLTSQGTATNTQYTGIPLNMMAAFWQSATIADQLAFFDNVTVSIFNPSIVLGSNPKPCFGSTMTTLSYTTPLGSPNQYSIDWDTDANTAGFTDVLNAAFPASPIPIPIPPATPIGTYHGALTVRNSTTLCASATYPIFVQIKACTPPFPSSMRWVLLQNGEHSGNCVSSSGCTNDVLCYGLEYTPLYTGIATSYTGNFFTQCNNGANSVLSNGSCVMHNNSQIFPNCGSNSVLFISSGNDGTLAVVKGVPQIIHQLCFTIPFPNVLVVNKSLAASAITVAIDSAGLGGFETDLIAFYTPLTIDSVLACGALPLKWLSFNAVRYDDLESKLDWSTTEEINVSHFEVERSNDYGGSFRVIGTVKASAEFKTVNDYQFIDHHADKGKNFYRIRQVDFDDQTEISPIKVVTFAGKNSFKINAWPNPVSDMLTIEIRDATEAMKMTIVDISGRIVWKGSGESGSSMQLVDVSAFGAGVYSLIAEGNAATDVKKIVVIR